jgi:hypothetical protein
MQFFRGESYSSSVAFLGFKASEFMLVEEIVRKLPIQFAQDELRVLFIVPSQGGHGEQQFGERLEKMPLSAVSSSSFSPSSRFVLAPPALYNRRSGAGLVPKI